MGIVEIIVILAVALIVIPPENLPDVMRATGKVLRELRLASNMVMRELGGALDQPADGPPPLNTMKPAGASTGVTIAQTAPSADENTLAAAKTSVDSAESTATPPPSATAPDGPKAAG